MVYRIFRDAGGYYVALVEDDESASGEISAWTGPVQLKAPSLDQLQTVIDQAMDAILEVVDGHESYLEMRFGSLAPVTFDADQDE